MWDKVWDDIFTSHEWGKYPCEQVVRFMARNYYDCVDRKDVKVLEIGSGTGVILWYLSREGFSVYGIDGSKVGVERSEEWLKNEDLEAEIKIGDAMNLPYEDNFFDCVIDNECLCSNTYKDTKIIIKEVVRVLKFEGKFFSKTFMTGTTGSETGEKLVGEDNTFIEVKEGVFKYREGVKRFTSEKEIKDLYGCFNIETIDYLARSNNNREDIMKEWIIICKKEKNF